jgi:hypothetical protein
MTVSGKARASIAAEIVRLQSEYYGRGPTKVKRPSRLPRTR